MAKLHDYYKDEVVKQLMTQSRWTTVCVSQSVKAAVL